MNISALLDSQILYARTEQAYKSFVNSRSSIDETLQELKNIFESIFDRALSGEIRSFSSVYSRIIYCCEKMELDSELRREIISLRAGTLRFNIESHQNIQEILLTIGKLCHIIECLSGDGPTKDLAELSSLQIAPTTIHFIPKDKVGMISGIIRSVSPLKLYQDNLYYTIDILVEQIDELQDLPESIYLTISQDYSGVKRQDLISIRALLKEYISLNVCDCVAMDGENGYRSTKTSLIIIEPDYLIDVTDISSCFSQGDGNENMFLLHKLLPSGDSQAMFKGTLINDLLDAHLSHKNGDMMDVFRRSLSKNLLKGARYGGKVIKSIWDSVLNEHSDNIAMFAKSVSDENVIIEPTFISAKYGLQGRLDVMTQDKNELNIKNIYELKSGRAPVGGGLWKVNQIQVACYNMLLESTFGQTRRGTSALFYSSDKSDPIRNFLSSISDKIAITHVRNKIIDIIYRLSQSDYTPLDNLCLDCFGEYPVYKKADIEAFEKFYKHLTPLEKTYYQYFLSFSIREMLIAKTSALSGGRMDTQSKHGYAALWRDSVQTKEKNFSIIHSLRFKSFDHLSNTIILNIERPLDHNFRLGDTAILYPFTGEKGGVLHSQVIKGTISYLNNEVMRFQPRNELIDLSLFESSKLWAVEHDMMEKTYWSGISSLFHFLNHKNKARDIVFSIATPLTSQSTYQWDSKLSDNQNQSIQKALDAQDFFLLQGPPGTGKTSTAIMGILKHLLEKTERHITILAFTNRAVEEIAQKLRARHIDFLRLGHSSAKDSDQTISSISKVNKIDDIRSSIASKRVIISTVSSFSTRIDDLKEIVHFDELIVDEASQLTQVQLVGILPYFEKFILVGDQKQLPSVVAQSPELTIVKEERLRAIGICDLRDSLFESLYDMCLTRGYTDHLAMLDTHFRMHREIAALVNPFYNHKLKEGLPCQREERGSPRVVIIGSDFEPSPKKHQGEAHTVAKLLSRIKAQYGDKFSQDSVGVVTPFRAQIVAIKNVITDPEILENVTIDTVERFQGGEKDIIIVSFAVFSASQLPSIQSLSKDGSVDRKLNVTISRAREELILIGYLPVLSQAQFYDEILNQYKT